jgi:hypothetical protein
MKTRSFRIVGLLTILVLLSYACNLSGDANIPPTEPAATPTPVEAATATPLPPTETAPPTETPTPAATATETLTPEPSATPTVEVPVAEVARESNCRVGPAGGYDLVATYQAGKMLNIVALDLGGGFVFVQNPDRPEEQCYILENNIKVSGSTAALPQYTPPPSPTAAPNFTVEFWKFGTCKDFYVAHFKVVNTGSVQFRSAYVKVTDQRQNKSVEQSLLAFDLYEGCIIAKNISPLLPGGSGYLQSAYYKWDPRPNKQTAIIMLCTEQGLKGACVTKTLEFQNK